MAARSESVNFDFSTAGLEMQSGKAYSSRVVSKRF